MHGARRFRKHDPVMQNRGIGGAIRCNRELQSQLEFAEASTRKRERRTDHECGATANRGRDGETTAEESGETRARFLAMSRFKGKR